MKSIWVSIQVAFSALGGFLGWYLGGVDGFLYALSAFVLVDYITGVMCAIADKGRWLANKWGIDPKAKPPAVVHEDGRDYVPTNGWTVFAHQFSSIAGAGPVPKERCRSPITNRAIHAPLS